MVEALAGPANPGEYAQAGAAPAAMTPIGRVEKASGNVQVVRNGVSIQLNIGDAILKGDVVQTGRDSSVGISFIDGTAFSLQANARMVMNDMVYDPNGTSNSALLSLVQGTISFVAGQVAKTGDMRIDTPAATMGIRGTIVVVDISPITGRLRSSRSSIRDRRGRPSCLLQQDDPTQEFGRAFDRRDCADITPTRVRSSCDPGAGDSGWSSRPPAS